MDPDLAAPHSIARSRRSTGASRRLRQRDRLYAYLNERPVANVPRSEVDAHFEGMPARYWERVTKAELVWGLETIHSFENKLLIAPTSGSTVVADSRHCPERGTTKVMICAWDRPGLLAKIAAAFSALRINIVRADVYTRADKVALDLFEVSDLESTNGPASRRLNELVFLLEGALSEPPRFASIWASQFHKLLAPTEEPILRIEFDNDYADHHTLARVTASDRLGLLHDLLQGFTDSGVNIDQAIIETDHHLASDTFYVTDLKRQKILETSRLEKIRQALIASTTS